MPPNQTVEEIEIPQVLSADQVNDFVQKMATSIDHVSFNNIATIEQLSNAYAVFNKMKETRPELDTHVNVNTEISKLIELNSSNPALLEWVAPKVTYLNDMNFIQHENQMHLFTNITNISNFQITNKDGTLNRSLFSKLNRFNKLQYLYFSCSKWGQSIPDDTSDTTTFDVIVDQLPRSLQTISVSNLSYVKWDDFEPFVETLATRRPNLTIEMYGLKSILESRPRMMELVNSRSVVTN